MKAAVGRNERQSSWRSKSRFQFRTQLSTDDEVANEFGEDFDGTLNPGSCHQAHLSGCHMLERSKCDYVLVPSSANQQKARSNPSNC